MPGGFHNLQAKPPQCVWINLMIHREALTVKESSSGLNSKTGNRNLLGRGTLLGSRVFSKSTMKLSYFVDIYDKLNIVSFQLQGINAHIFERVTK